MSRKLRKRLEAKPKARARVFAALGDKTRLSLVAQLSAGEPRSIAQLSEESKLTRQAITKHLGVLERAGLVASSLEGRERLFQFDPEPIEGLTDFLDSVAELWQKAQGRQKKSVEK